MEDADYSFVLLKDGRFLNITPMEENKNPLLLVGKNEWDEAKDVSIEDIMDAEEVYIEDAKQIVKLGPLRAEELKYFQARGEEDFAEEEGDAMDADFESLDSEEGIEKDQFDEFNDFYDDDQTEM